MAKHRIVCPECGHRHTATIQGATGQTAGVRFKRTTGNQFETAITVPGELIENERYYTLSHQLLAAGAVGVSAGVLTGYFASIPWHVSDIRLTSEIIIGSALGGWAISWAWLAKERAWQLGKALPMAVNEYFALINDRKPIKEGVSFTVSHLDRAGRPETGRTINRLGELPVDLDRFNEWAQGVLVGKSLGITHWTPLAKGFSKPEYLKLLDRLTAGGIVVNRPGKGNALTGGGKRALKSHLLDFGITPPSPASETDFLGERLAEAMASNGGNTPLPRSGVRAGGENG